MPRPDADEVQTEKHHRAFVQFGGPWPTNPALYAGADAQYMEFGDVSNPVRAGVDPIWVHSQHRRNGYDRVASTQGPADLPNAEISFYRKHYNLTKLGGGLACPVNFYEVSGRCKDPSSLLSGWDDSVTVYSQGLATDRSNTGRTSFADDEVTMDSVTFVFNAVYDIGKLSFGEKGSVQVEREVIDIAYGSLEECADCGAVDDGTNRIYAVTKSSGAGSPGTPAEVVYTVNGGLTWDNVNITGLSGTADPTGIDVVGPYVVVLDTAGNGYYYAEINTLTGIPGATWTQVTTGFVTSKQPNDIFVVSPTEIYFCGNGGYLYKSIDITAGVSVLDAGNATTSNLQRIHGQGETLVAVGNSGAIVKSNNRGQTWATTTTSPTSATIRAIQVLDRNTFWIGTSGGKVYYSLLGGETFIEAVGLPGGAPVVIDDIVFATDEVGYIAARTSTPTARLFATYDGGASWSSSALTTTPRLQNVATYQRANRLAVPGDAAWLVMANNLAVAGLSSGGTDGVIYLGQASLF